MSYKFRLKLKTRSIDVSFDDRFHRIDRDTVMNRATVRKWGIKIGELSVFFQRRAETYFHPPIAAE